MQPANFALAAEFLESTPEPALIKSADGTYLFINAAFERAFGVKKSDVIGRKAASFGATTLQTTRTALTQIYWLMATP